MITDQRKPDITVRGGLINAPAGEMPTPPPRHQPDTPINKKTVKARADHKPYAPDINPDIPDAPPTQPPPTDPTPDEPDPDPTE